jgi:hypothetical protein
MRALRASDSLESTLGVPLHSNFACNEAGGTPDFCNKRGRGGGFVMLCYGYVGGLHTHSIGGGCFHWDDSIVVSRCVGTVGEWTRVK